jgi:ABC-2 type transport system permease protein
MRLLWSFVRRDAITASSYRTALLAPVLSIAVQVPLLYLLSRVFVGGQGRILGPYGGDYFSFLLLGIAVSDYVALSISSFLNGIRDHQLMGTLEIVMLSPTPVPLILLYSSVWSYLFTSLRFALYLLVGLAFGLDLSHANPLSFVLLASAALVSFAALGILGAAATLLIKQAASVSAFLTTAAVAFGGVAYPIELLPSWLARVALCLPFTHALSGVRKALLLGASPRELGLELSALTGFAALLLPVALLAFSAALRRSQVAGTLGQY